MLYIFMGPSCTGKSTAVKKIKDIVDAEVFAGKDYLRMAKGEHEAWQVFFDKLRTAASDANDHIVYLITDKAELERVADIQNAHRIRFTAPLETIKERFSQRMNGRMPGPVEKMLEKQSADWEGIEGELTVDTSRDEDLKRLIELFEAL
jgi:predicted kinase